MNRSNKLFSSTTWLPRNLLCLFAAGCLAAASLGTAGCSEAPPEPADTEELLERDRARSQAEFEQNQAAE